MYKESEDVLFVISFQITSIELKTWIVYVIRKPTWESASFCMKWSKKYKYNGQLNKMDSLGCYFQLKPERNDVTKI